MTNTMKKKLLTMVLSGTMLASGLVAAEGLEFDPKVYLGAEVSGNSYNGVKTLKINNSNGSYEATRTDNKPFFGRSGAGISGFIGARLNQCFGLEAGYGALTTPKFVGGKTSATNGYVDALGFMPIADQVELIGSVGVGVLSTKVSGNVPVVNQGNRNQYISQSSSKAGVRLGAGLAYKFDECLGARLMVRYQQGNKHIKSITSAGVGLFYQF